MRLEPGRLGVSATRMRGRLFAGRSGFDARQSRVRQDIVLLFKAFLSRHIRSLGEKMLHLVIIINYHLKGSCRNENRQTFHQYTESEC